MNITISASVLDYLKKLEKNNNREWFNEHKKEFKSIETDIKKVYNSLFELLKTHDDVDALKMFRIYRDVENAKRI